MLDIFRFRKTEFAIFISSMTKHFLLSWNSLFPAELGDWLRKNRNKIFHRPTLFGLPDIIKLQYKKWDFGFHLLIYCIGSFIGRNAQIMKILLISFDIPSHFSQGPFFSRRSLNNIIFGSVPCSYFPDLQLFFSILQAPFIPTTTGHIWSVVVFQFINVCAIIDGKNCSAVCPLFFFSSL